MNTNPSPDTFTEEGYKKLLAMLDNSTKASKLTDEELAAYSYQSLYRLTGITAFESAIFGELIDRFEKRAGIESVDEEPTDEQLAEMEGLLDP